MHHENFENSKKQERHRKPTLYYPVGQKPSVIDLCFFLSRNTDNINSSIDPVEN